MIEDIAIVENDYIDELNVVEVKLLKTEAELLPKESKLPESYNYLKNIFNDDTLHEHFVLRDNGELYEILEYIGKRKMGTNIYLPKTYKGKPIVKVAEMLFANMRCINTIIIDSPLTIMPKNFCNSNTGLDTIILPDTIEIIGNSAFYCNYKLANNDFPLYLKKLKIKPFTIV